MPDLIKVHPIVGLAACKHKQGMGYALWALARAIDTGDGIISAELLRATATNLRWPQHQWRRALAQAVEAGMLRVWGENYGIASLLNVTKYYGLDSAGNYPVMVPAAATRKLSGWKATLWGAFHASRGRKNSANPISRYALELKTDIKPRTQQRLDRKARVRKTPTFAAVTKQDTPSGYAAHLKDSGRKGHLIEIDGRVWERRSNIYTSTYETAKRGSCRKVRHALNALLPTHGGQRRGVGRVYFNSREAALKALEKDTGIQGAPSAMEQTRRILHRERSLSGGTVLYVPIE